MIEKGSHEKVMRPNTQSRRRPEERDTRRFTCQNGEAGTSDAQLDRPGVGDQTLSLYSRSGAVGGANRLAAGHAPPAEVQRFHGELFANY
jgi:hypothetical protein